MSEEIAAAIGTIEYWQRRAEQAEADAAALRQALSVIIAGIKDHARRDLGDYLLITPTAAVFARATLKVRPSGAALLAELAMLRELRDDVQRWREGGGDVRDLHYVLETLEKASKS